MEKRVLQREVNKIKMPKEMEDRIIQNCYQKMEDEKMRKNTSKKLYLKPMAAVAAMALCLCVTGITAMASTGKLQGFFKDITKWNGAVTGTAYEQATNEVILSAVKESDELMVTLTMKYPKEAPYITFETLGIEEYQIVDDKGDVLCEGTTTPAAVSDGKVTVGISLDDVPNGDYKLVITKLTGGKKADQPLVLSGNWECEFVR